MKLVKSKEMNDKLKMSILQVERARIMDRIYLNYDIKAVDLIHATKIYNLQDDPDLVAAKNANKAQLQQF